MSDLDKAVVEMRALADFLTQFSFPLKSREDEDDISLLKMRDVVVDGYEVVVNFGKIQDGVTVECLQCLGRVSPFLPFSAVVKIARRFLGDEHLGFVDLFINDKKIYCWLLNTDAEGNAAPPGQNVVRTLNHEGFEFGYLDRSMVNFF